MVRGWGRWYGAADFVKNHILLLFKLGLDVNPFISRKPLNKSAYHAYLFNLTNSSSSIYKETSVFHCY